MRGIVIRLHRHAFCHHLRGPVEIHGLHGLVATEEDELLHASKKRCADRRLCPQHINSNKLTGIIFSAWHVFQRRRVNDALHPLQRQPHAVLVPHIAQQITDIALTKARTHPDLQIFMT